MIVSRSGTLEEVCLSGLLSVLDFHQLLLQSLHGDRLLGCQLSLNDLMDAIRIVVNAPGQIENAVRTCAAVYEPEEVVTVGVERALHADGPMAVSIRGKSDGG